MECIKFSDKTDVIELNVDGNMVKNQREVSECLIILHLLVER